MTEPLPAAQLQACNDYFGGNHELFLNYSRLCRQQFPHDVAAADQAWQAGDAATLHRIAHNLKTVLQTLGCPDLSDQARELEQTCASAGLTPAAHALWQALRPTLLQWPASD